MDHQQGPTWGRDDVDGEIGAVRDSIRRTAHVLVRTGLPDGHGDVQVTVLGDGRQVILGGFDNEANARAWAHVVAQVGVADIASMAETHAPVTEADIALHHDLTESTDLADVIRGTWTRIARSDVIIRPGGREYELVMASGGAYRYAGPLTTGRAESIRSAVLKLSKVGVKSTDATFDADGCAVRVSIVRSGSGFRMTLRPIRIDRN